MQNSEVAKACEDFLSFHTKILCPAAEEFFSELEGDSLSLHRAFSVNMLAAHTMDYLHAIRCANGDTITRSTLIKQFDEFYSDEEAALANRKFELVNLLNNSLKHIELDLDRPANKAALQHYGPIRFGALTEQNGRVYCLLQKYRFDFGRVILRSILNPLTRIVFTDNMDVIDFATGEWIWQEASDFENDDPIDQMIEYCNPACANCGELERECECTSFTFDGKNGRFEPLHLDSYQFDFDSVMAQISGAYRP